MNPSTARFKIQALLASAPPGVDAASLRKCALGTGELPNIVKQAADLAWGADGIILGQNSSVVGVQVQHPLGETRTPVDYDETNLQQLLIERVGYLSERWGSDPEKLYLQLWAALPVLGHVENVRWADLPADPRLPAHSWLAHALLTSALLSALIDGSHPSFLIFGIASPQEFISAARRTQDFWMGSYVFSQLMWAAMQHVAEQYGPDALLVPSLWGQRDVMRWLARRCGDAVPPAGRPTAASFGNLFTAVIPEREAENIAKACVEKVVKNWRDMACDVRETLEGALSEIGFTVTSHWQELWERQLPDLVAGEAPDLAGSAVYWAVAPWRVDSATIPMRGLVAPQDLLDGPGAQFHTMMKAAGRLHSARKQLRDFRQLAQDGWRCTLCGVRSALTVQAPENRPGKEIQDELAGIWQGLAGYERGHKGRRVKLLGRIRPNERLCAPCVVKRLAWEHHFRGEHDPQREHHLFPSTSSIAAAPYVRAVALLAATSKEVRDALGLFINDAKQAAEGLGIYRPEAALPALEPLEADSLIRELIRLGGDWLYEETYNLEKLAWENRIKIKPEEADAYRKAIADARARLEQLKEAVRCQPGADVPPLVDYYAVIKVDGDHLGAWVTGGGALSAAERSYGVERDLAPSPAHTLALAEALRTFSSESVERIVRDHLLDGAPAQGLLVFSGGDDMLALAPASQALPIVHELRQEFRTERSAKRNLLPGPRLTLTAGTAVVHRESPLGEAIEAARQAVKNAKRMMNGDALAIRVEKRAGEPVEVVLPWEAGGALTLGLALDLIQWFRAERLSRSFVTAAIEVLRMVPDNPAEPGALVLRRLILRHMQPEAADGEDADKEKRQAAERVARFYRGLHAELFQRSPRGIDARRERQTVMSQDPRAALTAVARLLTVCRAMGAM